MAKKKTTVTMTREVKITKNMSSEEMLEKMHKNKTCDKKTCPYCKEK